MTEDVEVTPGLVPSWKPTKKKPVAVVRHYRGWKTSLVAQAWWLWQVGELEQ